MAGTTEYSAADKAAFERVRVARLRSPGVVSKAHEELHVYVLRDKPQMVHIRMSPRSASGFYAMGDYHYLPEQPDDATLRDEARFAGWCQENAERLTPAWYREAVAAAAKAKEADYG